MADSSHLPDRSLRAADLAWSFDEVFVDEAPRLRRTAFLLLGSSVEAEEIVQEAFASAPTRWDELANPPAYLRSAVVHRTKNVFRHRDIERNHRAEPGVAPPDHTVELHHSLLRLPERQRAVIVLRYYVGLGDSDIAEMLDCGESTVRSSARRGLARLRKEVSS
jgi:RNA polymerase sigma factor (sigma-70 family)